MRAPTDEAELWGAYGPRVFAFCHRVLGDAELAADATQDAFLIAREAEGDFGPSIFRAARVTSFELLGRRGDGEAGRGHLSGAAGRLRPQQRAALALDGLEDMSYAEVAAVLGVASETVPALFARARLRLHDELHGTALAAAAVRSPDCEDVLPLLAAGIDGELSGADATWADPHVERCSSCPRSIRAMANAAAVYAAWSPTVPPAWLGAATLADAGDEAAPVSEEPRRRSRVVPVAAAATLVGATLATAASAALLVGSVHDDDVAVRGGARLEAASARVAVAAPAAKRHRERPAPKRPRVRVAPAPDATAALPATAPQPVQRPASRPAPAPAPAAAHKPSRSTPSPTPAPTPALAVDAPAATPDPQTSTAVAAEASPAAPAPAPAATAPSATQLDATSAPSWDAGKYRRRG